MTPGNKKRYVKYVPNQKFDSQSYEVYLFGEDPACFISTGKEIDENLIKEILGSKDQKKISFSNLSKKPDSMPKLLFSHSIHKKKNKVQTGMQRGKKATKEVSVLTEDRKRFALIVSKDDHLEEAF